MCKNSAGRAKFISFVSAHPPPLLSLCLPITAPTPSRLELDLPCSMRPVKTLFSPPDRLPHLGIRLFQTLFLISSAVFDRAFPTEVTGIADFHFVIVYQM